MDECWRRTRSLDGVALLRGWRDESAHKLPVVPAVVNPPVMSAPLGKLNSPADLHLTRLREQVLPHGRHGDFPGCQGLQRCHVQLPGMRHGREIPVQIPLPLPRIWFLQSHTTSCWDSRSPVQDTSYAWGWRMLGDRSSLRTEHSKIRPPDYLTWLTFMTPADQA